MEPGGTNTNGPGPGPGPAETGTNTMTTTMHDTVYSYGLQVQGNQLHSHQDP